MPVVLARARLPVQPRHGFEIMDFVVAAPT